MVLATKPDVHVGHNGDRSLAAVARLDSVLLRRFADRMVVDSNLSRQLVSYQASRTAPGYRWFRFKEAYSEGLVRYLLSKMTTKPGKVLDPFAGSGTTLFACSRLGIDADGIELLPVGKEVIAVRAMLESGLGARLLDNMHRWVGAEPWKHCPRRRSLNTLRITAGAYPPETLDGIERSLAAMECEGWETKVALRFLLMCVLEEVSYTRKDGQYLRWDERSGRQQGERPFNKGMIPELGQAIRAKLAQIVDDVRSLTMAGGLAEETNRGTIHVIGGSCIEVLPKLEAASYDAIVTSPPYCNRYDYTRTYALELALLGQGESQVCDLRQSMLTCTVENRLKNLTGVSAGYLGAFRSADQQVLLQTAIGYLEDQRIGRALNNNGIPRMVRGYFYETACVVAECARLLRPGAYLFMVNDNVRYAGASISVDLIMSDIADRLGLCTEAILRLPKGKGNSSQQMGAHCRDALRKCVYVWRRRA